MVEVPEQQSIKQYFLNFLSFAYKMRHFIPIIVLAGLLISFNSSSLSHLLPHGSAQDNKKNDTRIGIVLIFYGIGNVLGGYTSGHLCDRIPEKIRVGIYGLIGMLIACFFEVMILYAEAYSLITASIVGFCTSFTWAYFSCYMLVICTVIFGGRAESFAITKQFSAVAFIFYQWFVRFLNNQNNMSHHMMIEGIGIMGLGIFAIYYLRRHR